ncbi:MAG: mechanosensitive ion channel [Deltaproteobacteria bacterium]|nr:mechanosensitive ion channel [Deltaproteobacteria bacterium]
MNADFATWSHLEKLTWLDVLLALSVLVVARLLSLLLRGLIRRVAESASPHLRLSLLRAMPVVRLLIGVAALIAIVPIFVEPTFTNAVAVVASVGLALAFAFKDYGSSLIAGLLTVLENTYQPGDWIEMGGVYGEVKSIELRATRIVTADDTEVIVPNSRMWSGNVANATSGRRSLLCVAEFYLHPDHDGFSVRAQLAQVAEVSAYRKADTPVSVTVLEKPWGTKYRLKAYVKESRDQFIFITDLTLRGRQSLRDAGIRFTQIPYSVSEPA